MTEIQNIFSGQGSSKNQVSFDDTMFVGIKVVDYNLYLLTFANIRRFRHLGPREVSPPPTSLRSRTWGTRALSPPTGLFSYYLGSVRSSRSGNLCPSVLHCKIMVKDGVFVGWVTHVIKDSQEFNIFY